MSSSFLYNGTRNTYEEDGFTYNRSKVPLSERELLLETYPDSFGVPPRMEAHHKVEAYLDRAQPRAVRAAIDLAWEMQRG